MKKKPQNGQKGMIFGGEMMRCKNCGKEQRSNPRVESGWTAVQMDDHLFYYCPDCWSGKTPLRGTK